MEILVAGGAGFLGSNLCERLLKDNHKIYCFDNLLTGSEDNIKHLLDNPRFRFINHDVTKPLPKFFYSGLITLNSIYHLASPASPNKNSPKSYHALSFETMQVNTNGTWNLCELATRVGAKFLFASTSEAYGDPDPEHHPQTEEYRGNVSTTGPRSVYDEAKRFGETITAAFVRSRGLDGRIIRIFNTYGPRMALDDGRVVFEFVQAALQNKPFPIFGDGKQTRSFCYVDDLVDGILKAMEKGEQGEVYNLGNQGEFTILELAEKVKQITGSKSEIEFREPLPKDDPSRRKPDITKAKLKLGWEPKISLEQGLKRLIEYLSE